MFGEDVEFVVLFSDFDVCDYFPEQDVRRRKTAVVRDGRRFACDLGKAWCPVVYTYGEVSSEGRLQRCISAT